MFWEKKLTVHIDLVSQTALFPEVKQIFKSNFNIFCVHFKPSQSNTFETDLKIFQKLYPHI